ncbi:aromatic acid exporter family protein [Nocardiopsis nanhaiensis]
MKRRRTPATNPGQRRWLGRASHSDAYERHTLLLIGKSTLAAALAWVVARYLTDASPPAFAPFSAVPIMRVTVYQSLRQSLRYVGAVALGIAVQAVLGFTVGPNIPTFVIATLFALGIGRWRALGAQGPQVATGAFFAFATFVAADNNTERLVDLAQIQLLVVVGCCIGTAVNFLVSRRYVSTARSTRSAPSPKPIATCSRISRAACANPMISMRRTRSAGASVPAGWIPWFARPTRHWKGPKRASTSTPPGFGARTAGPLRSRATGNWSPRWNARRTS